MSNHIASLHEHPLVIETEKFLTEAGLAGHSLPPGRRHRPNETLMVLLDGPWLPATGARRGWLTDAPPPPEDIAAIQICAPKLLVAMGDVEGSNEAGVLLACIGRYNAWQQCLQTEGGALALVTTVAAYVETMISSPLSGMIAPEVCNILNTWLSPEQRWDTPPGPVTLCKKMFGSAWCDLILPAGCEDTVARYWLGTDDYRIASIIQASRPAFLPGLCPAQDVVKAEPLPSLGT